MEVSDLRKEIEKCLELSYRNGQILHREKYKEKYMKDIESIDEIMASYFGVFYNKEIGEYE